MENKRFAVTHSDEEWRRLLTPEQYQVLRGHGTEAPGSCALNYEKRSGMFSCAGCSQPLPRVSASKTIAAALATSLSKFGIVPAGCRRQLA